MQRNKRTVKYRTSEYPEKVMLKSYNTHAALAEWQANFSEVRSAAGQSGLVCGMPHAPSAAPPALPALAVFSTPATQPANQRVRRCASHPAHGR